MPKYTCIEIRKGFNWKAGITLGIAWCIAFDFLCSVNVNIYLLIFLLAITGILFGFYFEEKSDDSLKFFIAFWSSYMVIALFSWAKNQGFEIGHLYHILYIGMVFSNILGMSLAWKKQGKQKSKEV